MSRGGRNPSSTSPGEERITRAATCERSTKRRPGSWGKKPGFVPLAVLRSKSEAISSVVVRRGAKVRPGTGMVASARTRGPEASVAPAWALSGGMWIPFSGDGPASRPCLRQTGCPALRPSSQPGAWQRHESQHAEPRNRTLGQYTRILCEKTLRKLRAGQLAAQCPEHLHISSLTSAGWRRTQERCPPLLMGRSLCTLSPRAATTFGLEWGAGRAWSQCGRACFRPLSAGVLRAASAGPGERNNRGVVPQGGHVAP